MATDTNTEVKPEVSTPEVAAQGAPADKTPAKKPDKKPADGEKEVKKRKEAAEARLGKRANAMLEAAAAYAGQAIVAAVIALVRGDLEAFLHALGAPVDKIAEADACRLTRDGAHQQLKKVYGELRQCITVNEAGKLLVSRSKGVDTAASARQLIAGMTPAILAHNQPLLDELVKSLADFDAAETCFTKLSGVAVEAKADEHLLAGRLRCSVEALKDATRAGKQLATRDALVAHPVKRSYKRKAKSKQEEKSKTLEKPKSDDKQAA